MLFRRDEKLFVRPSAGTAAQFLDLAPMVDIMFTLILFFMLTSPFVTQWGIKVNLPKVSNVTTLRPSEVEIRIDANDEIFVSDRSVVLAELTEELDRLAEDGQPVMITGDIKASLGVVLEVWDVAKTAGVRELNIRTQIKKKK
ncbi:MAG: biopolymer transporter ExbD [Planctomycetes bacterium]|nr:biopolymer transporter ExbD [Planctomycetota bacterium]